jgi:hypothetical protein
MYDQYCQSYGHFTDCCATYYAPCMQGSYLSICVVRAAPEVSVLLVEDGDNVADAKVERVYGQVAVDE